MVLYCPNCGSENRENSKFCKSCGYNFPQTSSINQPQQIRNQYNPQQGNTAQCLWCKQSTSFQEEEGKLDSKWGVTAHKVKLFICNNCGYAHLFGLGRTIWDFD